MSTITAPRPTPDRVFAGGGAMGAMMRRHDWSATALGPVEGFPQSLRTALSILLDARFPMYIAWGREFVQFYNDDYRPILGSTKHPAALGIGTRTTFAEIWNIIGPMFEGVMNGTAVGVADFLLPLERHGYTEECYFTFSYSPIRDESQEVGGVLVTVNETTGRVLGERRLKTLGDLAKSANDHPTVDRVVSAAAEVLALNPKDMPFAQLWLFDSDGPPRLVHAISCNGGTDPARLRLLEAAHAECPVEIEDIAATLGCAPAGPWPEPPTRAVLVRVAKPGQVEPYGVLVAGVNSRRALDDDYRSFLGLVAGHLASSIATARAYEDERRRAAELAELDRAKTSFFSNVSHEFRTPLTLLLGPLEEAMAERESSPLQRERLEIAHRNALRLQRMVNTLLDFSRMQAGRIDADFRETDLAVLTADLASAFRSAFERADIAFSVSCEPIRDPVLVDEDLWEKIVFNLLSNAFKFTRSGSVAVALRQVDAEAVLTVTDTGTGIAAADLPRVFERFHRIHNPGARTQEGSGIGLSLASDLVGLHGGTLTASSEPGRGSTFTVRIPVGSKHLPAPHPSRTRTGSTALGSASFVKEALRWLPEIGALPPRSALASSASASPSSAETVLWVDDNADMRDYGARLLQPHWRVVTANDGDAALRMASEQPPDLIISDVMMPGIDGFALLAALRADPRTRDIPIILLSARAGEDASIDGMAAGADDYLVKPFTSRELLARVRAHLALARHRREAIARERRLREELARSNRDLEQFASVASHDLQEPLRTVSSYLGLIEERALSRLDERSRGYLTKAMEGAARMQRLTASLLDYAKVASDGARLSAIALDGVLDGVLETLAPALAQAGATVTRGALPEVVGDPVLLAQLLQNLIANAVRYRSDRAPAVRVSAQESDEEVVVSVADNGVGIDAQDQARIFQPFFRAAEHQVAGTGLGLAICKRIIERHGGRIWVESSREHGSTFRFTLGRRSLAASPSMAKDEITHWQSSDEFFRSVFMQAPASIAILRGPEHVFEFTNPRYLEMVGRVDLVGQTVREAFPEIRDSGVYEAFDRVYRTGEPFVASEYPIPIAKRGATVPELCYFSFTLYPLRDRAGGIYGQIGVSLDITAQVVARQRIEALAAELTSKHDALAASEGRFRTLADAMPQIVWTALPDGRVDYCNERWYTYTGVIREADTAKAWGTVIHPDDLARATAAWSRSVATGEQYEIRCRLRHGSSEAQRWHLVRALALRDQSGSIVRWHGTATDIHDQHAAEVELRGARSRLELVTEATDLGVWYCDLPFDELVWNPQVKNHFWLAPDAPVTIPLFFERLHPEDREPTRLAIDRSIAEHAPYDVQYRTVNPADGRWKWIRAIGRGFFAADGSPTRFDGITLDVTAARARQDRDRLFADVAKRLSTSLDADDVLQAIADTAVPSLADWMVVDLIDGDGVLERVSITHRDAVRREHAQRNHQLHPQPRDGLIWRAIDAREPMIIRQSDDKAWQTIARDGTHLPLHHDLGIHSFGIFPLVAHGTAQGAVTIAADAHRQFGPEEISAAGDLASRAAAALANARSFAQAESSRRRAETLHQVGLTIAGELDLQRVVQAITEAGLALTQAGFGAFFYNVLDEQGASYTLYAIAGVPREMFSEFPMPRATDVFGPTFRGEGVIRLGDVRKDPRFGKNAPYHGMPEGHLPVVSYLAVPVRSRNGAVLGGLFYGHADPDRFDAAAESAVVGLAAQAAVAIDNARLFDAANMKSHQLARANEELQQFAYVSSHDLQEPLRTVTQYLDLLEQRYRERLDERGRHFIGAALESATRMQTLLGDLLDYSRLNSVETRLTAVPLRHLLDEVLQDLSANISAAEADIRIGDMPTVTGEATKLRLLFQNLIGNALKFRNASAPVITISSSDGHEAWTFSVADNGIGIEPEHHGRIFEVFQRLHHLGHYSGSGIGLAICKRIVGQHGGRIWVESLKGHGATFRFTLPKAAVGAAG